MKIIIAALFLTLAFSAFAFELATTITRNGNTTTLQTIGYARVNLLKQPVSLKGPIVASGTLDIRGTANIVMWSKVEGAYYFSRLPGLQNVKDTSNLAFEIPFDAADKTITEVVIEVEMLTEGSVSLVDLSVGYE